MLKEHYYYYSLKGIWFGCAGWGHGATASSAQKRQVADESVDQILLN